ncbi:uncharacterized protein H6S33_008643 [Morchella sextelata]|uniref:uncharacterized protein n=1 Tax=Morchella sextelata TaxID=1174677 RepID=UPI001D038926|nr:uncharacterized protein H6S33_008643 [Morchella sextelata]KAH0602562.1 hypothetical protein H6S33_008643 [Morchella sextelata]
MGCVHCHKHTSSEYHQRSRARGDCRPSKLPLPLIHNTTTLNTKPTSASVWSLGLWSQKDSSIAAMVQSLGVFEFNTPVGRVVTKRVMKLDSVTGTAISGVEISEEYASTRA